MNGRTPGVPSLAAWLFGSCILTSPTLYAVSYQVGPTEIRVNNRFVVGGGIRLEEPARDTIGKLNLNPDLCPDDCLSLTLDPEPNQRLVDAPGAFVGANFDDGNLNYDQWDLINAQARLETGITLFWGEAIANLSTMAFFDTVNVDFLETNTDTNFQPARMPRPDKLERESGASLDLIEAKIAYPFQLFDTYFQFSIGQQRVRWGESTFLALGSLDQLNPPDQNRLNFPGSDIASVFRPTGLAVLSGELTPELSVELVYQYDWERAEPASAGTFFSTNDIAGDGPYGVIGLGQTSEDPLFVGGFKNQLAQLLTSTALNVPIDHSFGEPRNSGQYGGKISFYLPDFNGGTGINLYALNYHARLPYASTFATDASCLRNPPLGDLPDTGDLGPVSDVLGAIGAQFPGLQLTEIGLDAVGALINCGGGDGASPLGQALANAFPGENSDPLPVDTAKFFIDYPEDIRMFGVDFNTQFGNWSLAGEYVFRPNQPVLISLADTVFATLQPALPDEDIALGAIVVPSNRNAIPDFVQTIFRNDPPEANQLIRGYERLKVHQVGLTGIRVFSKSNWIGADQIILLTEAGFTYIQDMPSRDVLQLEGGGPNCTHASPGADGTGQADGEPDPRSLNPTQARGCFADSFSTGYRILSQSQYNNLLFGWSFNMLLGLFHDVKGVGPAPAQNHVEGRIQVLAGSEVEFAQGLRGRLLYQGYMMTGAEERVSLLKDRDHLSLHVEYNF
ncbi:DUF1302 domain-containing protein [Algiphilus sp.]|uniref:DUF1302 domain-containing protein n=1 Tax=Algiphilus sp. TaxID=1872431 RepID=UPI003B52DDC1